MIKSTDLHQGMKLKLKDVELEVVEIKHEKRKTIAVCKDLKGKPHEHSVSDLYYGNAKVISVNPKRTLSVNPKKQIPVVAKAKKPAKKVGKRTVTYVKRGDGIATVVRDSSGKMNWSSWSRNKQKK